jgi:biopolymer transport protein ExbD
MFWHLASDSLSEVQDVESLRGLFAERAAADRELVVIVKVAPQAPYRRMVDVLDELALAKVSRVTSVPLEGPELEQVNAIP